MSTVHIHNSIVIFCGQRAGNSVFRSSTFLYPQNIYWMYSTQLHFVVTNYCHSPSIQQRYMSIVRTYSVRSEQKQCLTFSVCTYVRRLFNKSNEEFGNAENSSTKNGCKIFSSFRIQRSIGVIQIICSCYLLSLCCFYLGLLQHIEWIYEYCIPNIWRNCCHIRSEYPGCMNWTTNDIGF